MSVEPTLTQDIDSYIAGFPPAVQEKLAQIRAAIQSIVPDATEGISYGIPVFKLGGRNFIFFAGFKNHVSLYPAPRGVEAFKAALSEYKGGKGTVQFPLDSPLPLDLIGRIVTFKAQEARDHLAAKKK